MTSLEATAAVVGALEELNIPYMLVGAFSVNAYSIPRSTKDADFVVELQQGDLTRLAKLLGPEFRLDRQMQFETITNTIRNVIEFLPTAFKIELFRLTNDPHHVERFRRRRRERLGDTHLNPWMPSSEDVVIQKLRWGRPKDVDDATNVLAVSGSGMDHKYIEQWTQAHSSIETYRKLMQQLASMPNPREG
jgi:hypothetical protein